LLLPQAAAARRGQTLYARTCAKPSSGSYDAAKEVALDELMIVYVKV
jgi:hypothetical protein